jgi:hypothetical protein
MNIEIHEAGRSWNCGYSDALGIYVGNRPMVAKSCGGVKLALGAASNRTEHDIDLLTLYVANRESRFKRVVLLYDGGQASEAIVLLEMIKKVLE